MGQFSILDWGVATEQGSRAHQEDRYTCLPPDQFSTPTPQNLAYFAVYDGHGGIDVADHARKTLHNRIAANLSLANGEYENAISNALKEQDQQLYRDYAAGMNDAAEIGSTVALCLVDLTARELIVANIGDSHIVLAEPEGSGYRPRRLTRSHAPSSPGEKARIEKAGGYVRRSAGDNRIGMQNSTLTAHSTNYMMKKEGSIDILSRRQKKGTINMSRALGDLQYKQPLNESIPTHIANAETSTGCFTAAKADFISNTPHINHYIPPTDPLPPSSAAEPLSKRKSVLILATDGVGNFVNDAPLCEFVAEKTSLGVRAEDVAKEIVGDCAEKRGSDNCTCVVVVMGDV
ncbi:hypothetical protein AJ80_00305 [Polytolypa hystricis UAMH7299]|uniref:protein-serine/threonine phosphatase n=1 Tax=Polytolypa hystricis (strain UAMH7299) TaxID=1447883 RepID=A0A2B7Z3R6_POLH7|nr:hypothetical protein AJ80_00305 [Polytolypa hystricis UAMH7299]